MIMILRVKWWRLEVVIKLLQIIPANIKRHNCGRNIFCSTQYPLEIDRYHSVQMAKSQFRTIAY